MRLEGKTALVTGGARGIGRAIFRGSGTRHRTAKVIEAVTRGIPLERVGRPEEIADAVRFLVSPEADFITGQTLSVSGGLTMC